MDTAVAIVEYSSPEDDEYGRPVRVELSRTISMARLEQRGSTEGEAFVADRWRIALPAGTKISADAEVWEGNRKFRVDGTPNHLSIPGFSALDRTEAELIYVGAIDA
jgi:hypothetical protein